MWPKNLRLDALQASNVLFLLFAGCNNNKKSAREKQALQFHYGAF